MDKALIETYKFKLEKLKQELKDEEIKCINERKKKIMIRLHKKMINKRLDELETMKKKYHSNLEPMVF